MQRKSSHEKTASAKLTFVILSDAEKPSKTFKASRLQLVLLVLFGFVIIGALSVFIMIETPLGKLILPEYFSTRAEQLERIRSLEGKVEGVQQQLAYLASYNFKLRGALGDTGIFADTINTQLSPRHEAATSENQIEARPESVETKGMNNEGASLQSMPVSPGTAQSNEGSSLFPLLMPAQGFVTRSVDYSIQHYGLDISAPEGESIVAPAAGEVLFADWTLSGGNTLIIAHANDYITVYKHCERILVNVGTKVTRGEAIALIGSTGVTSTGPHLHFELWQNGKNLNPENYLLTKN
ncbi:MAG TPA: M23 family metallopeptidase [Candidatus Acidoferrales bacterium]|nr:M23 family metallopeptidase [Candidatus Acidoferrales bacterium]